MHVRRCLILLMGRMQGVGLFLMWGVGLVIVSVFGWGLWERWLIAVCAVFHHLCPDATVVGIDHIQGLADMARANLAKDGVTVVERGPGVRIVCGDGRAGFKELGGYYGRWADGSTIHCYPCWSSGTDHS